MKNKLTMTNLENKLESLYLEKENIENEIKTLEEQINIEKEEKRKALQTTFTKEEKINIFKSLFISRQDIYAKKWLSKDGNKQGFYPVTRTFQGDDYIPLTNKEIEQFHEENFISYGSCSFNEPREDLTNLGIF